MKVKKINCFVYLLKSHRTLGLHCSSGKTVRVSGEYKIELGFHKGIDSNKRRPGMSAAPVQPQCYRFVHLSRLMWLIRSGKRLRNNFFSRWLFLFLWVFNKIIQSKWKYRKIPKISPGAYIFQGPFLRGLFLEELIFGRAYLRREICFSKSIGLACSGKEICHFCFVLLCIRGQIPSTSHPGGLYSEGFLRHDFGELIFRGAYFPEFYGM